MPISKYGGREYDAGDISIEKGIGSEPINQLLPLPGLITANRSASMAAALSGSVASMNG